MTITEKIMDASRIWNQAAMVFPYFHHRDIDWDETYRTYLERAVNTRTDREHGLLMAEFVNCLGDGHTDLSFCKSILDEAGYFPFSLEYLEGGYCIDGERVLGFNGWAMEEVLQEAFRYVYHVGDYVPRLRYILPFLLVPGTNTVETVSGSREFTMLQERPAVLKQDAVEFILHGDVLRIKLDDFLRDRSGQIREKLLDVKPSAVILDIRENIGGMTKHGADIAQLFISGKFGGCKKWTRTMTGVDYASASQIVRMSEVELNRIMSSGDAREEIERSLRIARHSYFKEYEDSWGKDGVGAVFDGPLVLLTSRKTVSAAEDFAAFFKTNKRAVMIGTPTCGTSGTPLLQHLSCGTLRVCSVGYQLRDGTQFIGTGIQPDIQVEPEWNRDTVLEFALHHLI